MGEHEINERTKIKELKPISEIVTVPVPPIIDLEILNAVQKLLKAHNPKIMPARVISGPTMLTSLIHCAKCGGAMTIRTGKGRPLSLLRLFHDGAAGADRLRGYGRADGEAGRSGWRPS